MKGPYARYPLVTHFARFGILMLPLHTTLSTSEGSSLSERVGLNLGGGMSTSVVIRGVISLDLVVWDFDFLVS